MDKIEFTAEKLKELKEKYVTAVNNGSSIFVFEGKEWVTDYAKYVIEYLNEKFKVK